MRPMIVYTGGRIKSAASRAYSACRGEHRGSVWNTSRRLAERHSELAAGHRGQRCPCMRFGFEVWDDKTVPGARAWNPRGCISAWWSMSRRGLSERRRRTAGKVRGGRPLAWLLVGLCAGVDQGRGSAARVAGRRPSIRGVRWAENRAYSPPAVWACVVSKRVRICLPSPCSEHDFWLITAVGRITQCGRASRSGLRGAAGGAGSGVSSLSRESCLSLSSVVGFVRGCWFVFVRRVIDFIHSSLIDRDRCKAPRPFF